MTYLLTPTGERRTINFSLIGSEKRTYICSLEHIRGTALNIAFGVDSSPYLISKGHPTGCFLLLDYQASAIITENEQAGGPAFLVTTISLGGKSCGKHKNEFKR